ncbi:mitochondrial carrier [Hymenopellis radicata]|nr:mitochondrial carrier [Hymenopellis radicata]
MDWYQSPAIQIPLYSFPSSMSTPMAAHLGSLIVGLPALALSAAVAVPINGVLVRFRANYTPRRVQLDEEGASSGDGYWKYTYFTMAKRVYDIEGLPGFWKGFWPSFLTLAAIFVSVLALVGVAPHLGGRMFWSPAFGVFGSIGALIVALLVGVPVRVIICRAAVTPYKLSARHPWISFRTLAAGGLFPPGMLAAAGLSYLVAFLIRSPLHWLLTTLNSGLLYPLTLVPLIAYYIFALAFSILLTPLDVAAIRLAVQGSHSATDGLTAEDVGETVVKLRDEQIEERYEGLLDCLKKIRDEEGFTVLYRGWWVTFLFASYFFF